jgi:hypothetical protein
MTSTFLRSIPRRTDAPALALGSAHETEKIVRAINVSASQLRRTLMKPAAIAVGQDLLTSFGDAAPCNDQRLSQLGSRVIRDSVEYLERLDENGLPPEIERVSYEREFELFLDQLGEPESPDSRECWPSF